MMAKKQIKKKSVRTAKSAKKAPVAKKAKTLYRTTENKMVAGVLAGIAEYFNYDPTIVRLLFIVLVLITGIVPGILIYILAAILVPKKAF
jgi:phage shock protein C